MATDTPTIARPWPDAGDAVRLAAPWAALPVGALGIIDGCVERPTECAGITFNARTFRGPVDDDGLTLVCCGGDPATISIPLADLDPTGEETTVTVWRWRTGRPRAYGGVEYQVTVPVWSWDPARTQARGDDAVEVDVDTPVDKWRLIASASRAFSISAPGRARHARARAALRDVYGLPDDATNDEILAASRADRRTVDDRARALLAAYARRLDRAAAPVDLIALPFVVPPTAADLWSALADEVRS